VDTLGPECARLKVGDRVGFGWLRHTCGVCEPCWRGRENLCVNSLYTGYHADGGYAQCAVVPEDFAYRLPAGFDDVQAAPLLCSGIVGYRALRRAAVPKGGSLLLAGFGSSAHLILQIAVHRGHQVCVLTRSAAHQRLSRELGAVWAGDNAAQLPEKADSAILFAPAGEWVPPILGALKPGGTLALAGIHMSPIPSLDYAEHLYGERDIHPVTANTREDGRAFLAEATAAKVKVQVKTYPLADANTALADVKHSRVDGTAVLAIA
jgi:propanol-preferring alcohol dehydrogenase